MASYVITDTTDVDWAAADWTRLRQFKYRRVSREGRPAAQDEFDSRKGEQPLVVLWRFDRDPLRPKIAECWPRS